jgi:signal transduction histidine kinase
MTFGELRKKQNRMLVEDYGLGLGLSNSKEIAKHIGGDVSLVFSDLQCTVFEVKIPVDFKDRQAIQNLEES